MKTTAEWTPSQKKSATVLKNESVNQAGETRLFSRENGHTLVLATIGPSAAEAESFVVVKLTARSPLHSASAPSSGTSTPPGRTVSYRLTRCCRSYAVLLELHAICKIGQHHNGRLRCIGRRRYLVERYTRNLSRREDVIDRCIVELVLPR